MFSVRNKTALLESMISVKLQTAIFLMCHSDGLTESNPPTSKKKNVSVVNDELIPKRRVGMF